MKRILTLLLCTILIQCTAPTSLFAATTTPTPKQTTPSPKPTLTKAEQDASESAEQDTIEKIKEMVASKVSKLNLVEKKGVLGTVKDVSNTQITIETPTKTQRFVDIDELTKFQDSLGSSKNIWYIRY